MVRFAPIANSADGLGGEIAGEEPRWSGFGHAALPAADLGLAIASPVLRMREGTRTVTLSLALGGLEQGAPDPGALAGAFEAFVTGEKGWLGPYGLSAAAAPGDVLRFQFQVPATEKAVVDYERAVHGYAYSARAPLVQLLLKPDGAVGYLDVRKLTLRRAQVSVQVSGVTTLALENDLGTLDPKKAFLPFGPEPVVGSRLMVGCDEALSKKLSALEVRIRWHGAPGSFASHYANYGSPGLNDSSFTAGVSFRDGGHWQHASTVLKLF